MSTKLCLSRKQEPKQTAQPTAAVVVTPIPTPALQTPAPTAKPTTTTPQPSAAPVTSEPTAVSYCNTHGTHTAAVTLNRIVGLCVTVSVCNSALYRSAYCSCIAGMWGLYE
jgi:hypothetical protein